MAVRRVSIADIKRRYHAVVPRDRAHWFEAGTLRFFNGRLPTHGWEGPGGVFFAHSIQYDPLRHPEIARQHKVARLRETSPFPGVDTAADDRTYATAAEAEAVAKRLAGGGASRARSSAHASRPHAHRHGRSR